MPLAAKADKPKQTRVPIIEKSFSPTLSMTTVSTKSDQAERRAIKAGLVCVEDINNGIKQVRCGNGFSYKTPSGRTLMSKRVRARIDSLIIPPAWDDVYICRQSNGHLQAVGTDEAGRRQYLYHERWKEMSTASKFDRMHLFGDRLPRIRRRALSDLNEAGITRRHVLAAVVRVLVLSFC